jgi:signal transduction histidine kinase
MPYLRFILMTLLCACRAIAADPDGKTQKAADDQALFGDLPTVEAVALHAQTLAEAPANVSVITAADIRHYGYRTLAEALASVRGFYVTNDHTYHYVGVSGVSLPGDFNTRLLVMLNGHPLTDNIYNSNGFFGQDFGLDMDLVERIEIIRGPTSARYGSNGMLTNINVVTCSPVDGERLRVSTETDSFGERKLSASSSLYLGGGANLLVSGSAFNNTGISFPPASLGLPPQSVPPGASGSNADGERAYHTFANLIWHDWSFTAYFNSRDKQPPVGLGTSLSDDPSQHVVDGRSMAGATYKHQVGPGKLQWQISYDRYRCQDRYDYPVDGQIQAVRDYNRGDWVDSQLTYELPVRSVGSLAVGVEGSWELRNLQFLLIAAGVEAIELRTLLKPLQALTEFTVRVAEGDLSGRAEVVRPVEVGRLTLAFNRMVERLGATLVSKDAAEAADAAKTRFLATMSHELRTPLNAAIGYSQLIQEVCQDRGIEGLADDLGRIERAGGVLLHLVNQVLDYSKAEAGRIELYPETFLLPSVVQDVIDTVAPLAGKNRNRVTVNASPDAAEIHADLVRFRQSLLNLVSNACKFTQDGEVSVAVSRERTEPLDSVLVSVRDTGVGIPPEQQSRLFQAFVQGDASTTRKYGGAGLGLAISRKLCRLMGGDIWVESAPGKGSNFLMRIPVGTVPPDAREEEYGASSAAALGG